ncbi:hypothetical protein [Mycolicibacterium iranicum]|uniref:Uncharacterized protein n=1 Tax=Mycolicibacterium iranicum TaxID=912594 RepID=A0A178LRT5_MYCIR|nr:hypothetical protein [Mycolicibacterium iranicum]OAN36493.1 hypothetical protein A4X20_24480 [Mycolicibacterium iranicum]
MTNSTASDDYDIHLPDGVETRFGIRMLSYDEHASEVVMTMPMAATELNEGSAARSGDSFGHAA